ncbi:MAG: tetratricopeptide repeat protein [Verrucomicrobiales bacterium]|nr:tetratricopeptide repeat protein [Verrucomicrobiales bacterium]
MTEKTQQPASAPVPVAETTEEISDVLSQLETHKKTVILAIVGAALVLSGVIVFRGITSEKHLAAAQAYSQAANSRNIEELDQVIADFPKSVAAGDALLTKAELQVTSGKTDDARSTLLAFTEKYSSHPRHSQGLFAMGNLYQVGGDNDNASKYYDRVLKEYPKTDLAPFVMIRQGDLLLAAGKKDEARQKYEAIMPAYRGTPFFERVEEKIKLLEIEKLPVVDEPKKPSPKKVATKTPATTKTPAKPVAKPPAKATPKPNKPAVKKVKKEAPKKAANPSPAANTKMPPVKKAPAKKAKTPPAKKAPATPPSATPAKKKVAEPKKAAPPKTNKADKKPSPATPPVTEKKEAAKKADPTPTPDPDPAEKK